MAQRRIVHIGAIVLAAALVSVGWFYPAMAQQAAPPAKAPKKGEAPPQPTGQARLDMDLLGLLRSRDVLWTSAEDAIWTVTGGPGRWLIQIPIEVKPGKVPTTFGVSEVKLRGGRFLTWKLTDDPELAPKGSEAARQIDAALGNDIPRFTRKVTINPDGTMEWGLDRFILQGEVKKSVPPRLYQMRLKREFMDELRPEPPKAQRGGGEDPAIYRARVAAQESLFRVQQQKYLETLKAVNALTEDFKEPLPPRIWAVFDLPMHNSGLDLSGLDSGDWKIDLQILQRLREVCKSPVTLTESPDGTKSLGANETELIFHLSGMAGTGHPFDLRMVAYVLNLTDMVKYAQVGDPLFLLIKTLLEGNDGVSQRIMVKELLNVIPPTRATASLMQLVAQRGLDVGRAVDVLKGLTQIDLSSSPDQVHKVLGTANQMLEDPKGPPPGEVLSALYKAAREQPASANMLAQGVQFNRIPPERLQLVLIDVIEQSGVEPLADTWLNSRFLGSADPVMLEQALQIIISAQGEQSGVTMAPLVRGGLNMVFGEPKATQATKAPTAKLKALIPITNANHGLYRALQHGDPKLRTLAWQAINQFELVKTGQEQQEVANRSSDRYQVLLELALNQAPTPPQVVAFFNRQPDQARATAAMVQIVLRGGAEASQASARALVGSGKPLADAMLGLAFGERQGFAMRMYENLTGRSAPLVTALLRQRSDRNPLVTWLGEQIAAGTLPSPAVWSVQFKEEELIDLASSNDVDLARGAVAALVNAIGGTDREASAFAGDLRRLPDQSLANLTTQWQDFRRQFYTRSMQRFGGTYRLVLRVFEPTNVTPAGGAQTAAPPPDRESQIGLVRLVADGTTVSIGNNVTVSVPSESLALRIDKPAELKNFPSDELAALPLEEVQTPVDLRPQPDGSLRGEFRLQNRRLELVMQPAREGA